MKTTNKLHKKIMRRIYAAFAVRIITHPISLRLGLMVLALFVFAKMVHVQKVIENFMNNSFDHAPQFIWNAIMRGEVLTLIALGVIIFSALSIQWRVRKLIFPKLNLV